MLAYLLTYFDVQHVAMIAGGSGITPMIQILHAVLGRIGLRPTQADPQLYVWHVPAKGARAATADAELELVLILSTHVVDLKGAGQEYYKHKLIEEPEKLT